MILKANKQTNTNKTKQKQKPSPFFSRKTIGSNNSFTLFENNIRFSKIEFKVTVQYNSLRAKCTQLWPLNQSLNLKIRLHINYATHMTYNYRLITAYLLLRVNLDKIMHARWDFDASSARTRRVSALDKHQNWSSSALFCLNSRAQRKYAVVNLIHIRRKQTFLSFIMW